MDPPRVSRTLTALATAIHMPVSSSQNPLAPALIGGKECKMPVEDPTEELEEILELHEKGKLPIAAVEWARGALDKTESILETIESMQDNSVDAPTNAQERALRNIYNAACGWLAREA